MRCLPHLLISIKIFDPSLFLSFDACSFYQHVFTADTRADPAHTCRRFHATVAEERMHESGSLIACSEPSDMSHTPPKRYTGMPHRAFSVTTSDPGAIPFDPNAAAPFPQSMTKCSSTKGRSLQQHLSRSRSARQSTRQVTMKDSLCGSDLCPTSRSNSESSESAYQEVTAAFIAPGKADARPSVLASLVQNSTPRTAFNSSPRHNHFEERHVFVAPRKRSPTTTPAPWDPSLLGDKLPTRASLAKEQSSRLSTSSPDASHQWPSRANSLQDLDQGGAPSIHHWAPCSEGKSDGQGLSDPLAAVQPSSDGRTPGGPLQDSAVGVSARRGGQPSSGGGGCANSPDGVKSLSASTSRSRQRTGPQLEQNVADKGGVAPGKPAAGATLSSPTGKITAIKGKGLSPGKGWAALRSKPLVSLNKDLWQRASETRAQQRDAASAAAAATSPRGTTGRRIGAAAAAEQAAEAAESAAEPFSGGTASAATPESPTTSSFVSGASPKRGTDPLAAAAAAKAIRSQHVWKRAFDTSRKLKVASAGISSDSAQVPDHPARGIEKEADEVCGPYGGMLGSEELLARGGVSGGLLSSRDKSKSAEPMLHKAHGSPRASNGAPKRRSTSKGDAGQCHISSSPTAPTSSGGCPPVVCIHLLCSYPILPTSKSSLSGIVQSKVSCCMALSCFYSHLR